MPGQDGVKEIMEMGGDPQNPFTSMVKGVSAALSKMQELLAGEGVSEDLVGQLGQLQQQYQSLLKQIMSAAGEGQAAPKSPGAPMMDANAGPKAIPAQ